MSKILKTAAIVVGAVALISTGIGAAAGAGLIGGTTAAGVAGFAGISAATFATVGTLASVAALGLSALSAVTAKKPGAASYLPTGSPQEFTLDPNAPLPAIFGRFATAASVHFRAVPT